jgi:hypothetical protein
MPPTQAAKVKWEIGRAAQWSKTRTQIFVLTGFYRFPEGGMQGRGRQCNGGNLM